MIFDDFLNFFQKIDLNEPEYVENYGDQFSAVQMIFYIAKKSIFINFIKIVIFIFFVYFLKKGPPHSYPRWRGPWYFQKKGRTTGAVRRPLYT